MSEKKIFYNETNYNEKEIEAVVSVLKNQSFSLVSGAQTGKLESRVSKMFGKKFGVFVNSGSSANLLALACLDLPKSSEVITPCLTFSTTISPILQLGLVPSLVDIDIQTLNVNVKQIEGCITEKTKAIMIPNLIGNLPDWEKISEIGRKHNLYIIEDSADTIGYEFKGGNTSKLVDVVLQVFMAHT